ncbi:MAG: protein-glutamate O-methyltransferase CheR [Sulfurospirillum sp.]|nr:protein-glutamate O-methyltransferase CheR [Sulfurospirillum sp.]
MFFRKKKQINTQDKQEPKQEEFNFYGIADILHLIKREIGVDLFGKKSILETRFSLFCKERGFYSFKSFFDALQIDKKLKQEFINLVTVNETYFLREIAQLQEAINFAQSKTHQCVKILCAPCASGEEVYSLAMLIESQNMGYNYEIIGIDINSEVIEKAKKGIYSPRSLHRVDEQSKSRFFRFYGDKYEINHSLFLYVSFKQLNIFDPAFLDLGKFDIIFSRNMLIYFDDLFRVAAMKRFYEILKPDGRVYLGHADIVPENEFFIKYGYGTNCYYTKHL